jgi:hypothetical protein
VRSEFSVRQWRDGFYGTQIVDETAAQRRPLALTESGMLGARNFISDNPNLNYSVKRDLELRAGPRPRSRTDFAALRTEAQAAGENVWATLAEWDPLGRTAESACPWCYPWRNEPA